MKSMKNGWYPEKGTVWNVCRIFWRINRKGIAIFYHKEDRIAIFCRLKDVFCFTGDWAESDIFQRKNGKLQQIWATNKSIGRSHLLHHKNFQAAHMSGFYFYGGTKPQGFTSRGGSSSSLKTEGFLHIFTNSSKPCLWRRSLCSLVKPLISFACEVFPLSRVMMVLFYFFMRDDSSKVIHFWNHQKKLLHLRTLVIGSILRSDNKNRFLYGNSENILLYSIILFGGVLAL